MTLNLSPKDPFKTAAIMVAVAGVLTAATILYGAASALVSFHAEVGH